MSGRWWTGKIEVDNVLDAQSFQLQHSRSQIRSLYFRRCKTWQIFEIGLSIQPNIQGIGFLKNYNFFFTKILPINFAGPHSSSSSSPLLSRRLRYWDDNQGVSLSVRIVPAHFHEPAINNFKISRVRKIEYFFLFRTNKPRNLP